VFPVTAARVDLFIFCTAVTDAEINTWAVHFLYKTRIKPRVLVKKRSRTFCNKACRLLDRALPAKRRDFAWFTTVYR
jgi:hypothetical protein